MPGEERERAAHFTADFRRRCPLHLAHPHGSAEVYHFVELFCVGERLIHALPARLEKNLLVDGFRRPGNFLVGSRPSLSWAQSYAAYRHANPRNQLPSCRCSSQCARIPSLVHHFPPKWCARPSRITPPRQNMFKIIFSWKGKPCSRHTSTRRTSLASRTCTEAVSAVSPLRVPCGLCELCVKQVSVGPNSQPNLLHYAKYLTRGSSGVSSVYHPRVRDGRLLRWRPHFPLNRKILANRHPARFDGSSPTPSAFGNHVALSITWSSPRSLWSGFYRVAPISARRLHCIRFCCFPSLRCSPTLATAPPTF